MSNTLLFLLVLAELCVIIWLASKLAQYRKFEQVLSVRPEPSPATTAARAGGAVAAQTGNGTAETSVDVDPDEELLNMPGVEPEANIEEAKRVQLVMARCHYAEFYLEQLDDDYEYSQFKHIVESCMTTARGIGDPFFKASALQPLIVLLDRAGWDKQRDTLLAEVEDDIIRQRIEREMAAAAEAG